MPARKGSVKIESVMTSNVETVSSSSSVQQAASMMKQFDIGALPVKDDGSLKGIVTDRDIALRLVAEGKDPGSTSVGDIMTQGVVTCRQNEAVRTVEKTMEQNRIRRVVIVNEQDQPVGVVSLGDIAAHKGQKEAGEVLEKVSEPVHSQHH
ncbi:MAG: CBS domain-containing protein [Deltaproteobacteria bacterium]